MCFFFLPKHRDLCDRVAEVDGIINQLVADTEANDKELYSQT
jgi:hypothetical protein